jgi:hypothetical protein
MVAEDAGKPGLAPAVGEAVLPKAPKWYRRLAGLWAPLDTFAGIARLSGSATARRQDEEREPREPHATFPTTVAGIQEAAMLDRSRKLKLTHYRRGTGRL